jgi:sigma-B regulation protein RsbU (phosphoserine phosphatase)
MAPRIAEADSSFAAPILDGVDSVVEIAHHLQDVQEELDALRSEVNILRRRDETLNYHMHRLDEELRLAARIQQDFLPKSLPQVGQVYFHTLFRPAGYVSGDLYDVMRLDERRIGFYIADAVGHGMPAALLTMFLKHALVTKEIGPAGYRLLAPSETLQRLNETLIAQNLSHAAIATALYGVIDVQTRQVTMSRAGHPLPLVLSADGTLTKIESEGGLLGVFPDERFADATFTLHPGDRLVLFTDGVEIGFGGRTPIDESAWHLELTQRNALGGNELIMDLSRKLDDSAGSLDPKDDLTLIVVEAKAA